MIDVELTGITKIFNKNIAVDGVSLSVTKGEFLSLLGPSGCGKTTTLRIIVGFVRPDEGEVLIKGKNVTHLPAYKRDMSMVFQNYALWPHLSVYDNVAFGLKIRKTPKGDISRKVKDALNLVQLSGFEDRFPKQLSGGQQQRVALARAIVVEPSVLLLDEPLSNLDKKLRDEMRIELKQLQKKLGVTTIYVTHDQEEALTMSDRVAVMNKGKIIQIGSPSEIYEKPKNRFIADFIGKTNFLNVRLIKIEENYSLAALADTILKIPVTDLNSPSGNINLAIRPEKIDLSAQNFDTQENVLVAEVQHVSYIGPINRYGLILSDGSILYVDQPNRGEYYKPSDKVFARLNPEFCFIIREE